MTQHKFWHQTTGLEAKSSPTKNNCQTNTLIHLTKIDPKPGDKNTIEAENRNITDSQQQALDKGRKMEKSSKVS